MIRPSMKSPKAAQVIICLTASNVTLVEISVYRIRPFHTVENTTVFDLYSLGPARDYNRLNACRVVE